MLNRRNFVRSALAGGAALLAARPLHAHAHPDMMIIWKTPTCGCCQKWVDHMKAAFEVQVHDLDNLGEIKKKYHVPANLASCHTAHLSGYVIEGHVPVAAIKKLLKEKPMIVGIAVPGMPIGSPGMEVGNRKDAYEIIAFDGDGKTSVFARG